MPKTTHFIAVLFLSALLLNSAQASDSEKCHYGLAGNLTLDYYGTSMMLTTQGAIAHTPAVMLIDTGSTNTILTRFGVDKRSLRQSATVIASEGVGGMTRMYRVPVDHFQIGPIKSEEVGSLMMIDEMGDRPTFDAIVGGDFLMHMDVEIFLAEKKLKFFSPHNCASTYLGYWNPNAVVTPLDFDRNGKRPLIEVEINGVKMRALIDSGSSISIIKSSAAKRTGISIDAPSVKQIGTVNGIGNKLVKLSETTFKTFTIADETINNAHLKIIDDGKGRSWEEFDVILGADFLRSHRVLFAVSQKLVYLSYTGGPAFQTDNDTSWLLREAEGGNSYAQFNLGMSEIDAKLNAGDTTSGSSWMDKAVASKNLLALQYMAQRYRLENNISASIALYEQLLASDPHNMEVQLELYLTRTSAGLVQQAQAGLEQGLALFKWQRWPAPIMNYYLGKVSLNDLFNEAASDSDLAAQRKCEVYQSAGALQSALQNDAQSKLWESKFLTECVKSPTKS